jgi:hypothetical protein
MSLEVQLEQCPVFPYHAVGQEAIKRGRWTFHRTQFPFAGSRYPAASAATSLAPTDNPHAVNAWFRERDRVNHQPRRAPAQIIQGPPACRLRFHQMDGSVVKDRTGHAGPIAHIGASVDDDPWEIAGSLQQ